MSAFEKNNKFEADNSEGDVNLCKLKMAYFSFPAVNRHLQQLVVLKSNGASAVKSQGFS